ncbi:cytochrome P450 [Biscogniauxia mediterranea]|nr:cytochrome P450 [Biscogniauxia mediterranea]
MDADNSSIMISYITTVLIGVLTTQAFLWALLRCTQDANEPPAVDTAIPFISAVARMGWKGLRYWGEHSDLPIYTVRLPGFRLYIVNSTALIPIVQRRVRTISFSPIMVQMAARYMAVSKETFEIISRDPIDNHGFVAGMNKTTHIDLSPGPQLDSLNKKSIEVLLASLSRAAMGDAKVSMRQWIDREITMATTDAIYGPSNPFRDPDVTTAWLKYEAGLLPLLVNILPMFTAREPAEAREVLVRAYEAYYRQGGHSNASAFIKHRCEFYLQRGIPFADIARIEVGAAIGLISNSKPAAFWLLYHICSDSTLLSICREELSKGVQVRDEGSECIVDITYIKSSCPVLFSTFKEVFRVHGMGIAIRQIIEDEMLDNRILLKKNSFLLIPADVQHKLRTIWGQDANSFNYNRFIHERNSNKSSSKRDKRVNPVAFRGFGGGSTLCPGRHFAATEILAFVSLVILRFDIKPLSGQWAMPTVKRSKPGIALHQPDNDIEIELTPRDAGKMRWLVKFSGSKGPMGVSAEDLDE